MLPRSRKPNSAGNYRYFFPTPIVSGNLVVPVTVPGTAAEFSCAFVTA